MEALSRKYGWTPDQIRSMKMDDINQYLEIINQQMALDRANAMRQKRT